MNHNASNAQFLHREIPDSFISILLLVLVGERDVRFVGLVPVLFFLLLITAKRIDTAGAANLVGA